MRILVDNREQLPYDFKACMAPEDDICAVCLLTGDYSIDGHTDQLCVERKSLPDLFSSVGQGRDRFEREFERMAEMEYAALVIEAGFKDCILNPPNFTNMNPKSVFRTCLAWGVKYGVHVHWCHDRVLAEKITYLILEKWWKYHAAS